MEIAIGGDLDQDRRSGVRNRLRSGSGDEDLDQA